MFDSNWVLISAGVSSDLAQHYSNNSSADYLLFINLLIYYLLFIIIIYYLIDNHIISKNVGFFFANVIFLLTLLENNPQYKMWMNMMIWDIFVLFLIQKKC